MICKTNRPTIRINPPDSMKIATLVEQITLKRPLHVVINFMQHLQNIAAYLCVSFSVEAIAMAKLRRKNNLFWLKVWLFDMKSCT